MIALYQIDASSRIVDAARNVRGRLGAVLMDSGGGYPVALAPVQFAGANAELRIKSEGPHSGFRCSVNRLLTEDKQQPAENLLAIISLPRRASISGVPLPGQGLAGERAILDPWQSLGAKVLVWTDARRPVRVTVRSAQASFEMKRPSDGELTCFVKAVCLKGEPGAAFLAPEDIGAIVTSEAGALLGVVVCGRPDIAYVAPAANICRKHKFTAFDEASLARFAASAGRKSAIEAFYGNCSMMRDMFTEALDALTIEIPRASNDGQMSSEDIDRERRDALRQLV